MMLEVPEAGTRFAGNGYAAAFPAVEADVPSIPKGHGS